MEIILYHGTTDVALQEILAQKRLQQSTGFHHYLGKGIYFYDDFIQAKVWAKMKARHLRCQPAVIRCKIKVLEENYLNLDGRAEQDFFFNERNKYISSLEERRLKPKEYYIDSKFCDFISSKLKIKLISKTFVYIHPEERQIPYVFSNTKVKPYNVTRIFRTEKQYCVKDQGIIIDVEEVTFY